ncbi:MAG: hypothetical protein E4H14_19525 [Candidatus Thorarchaeota archaeon]|nr:MAG: hypothetical protein E4H14_19525 [Candidatus Thorarchaeota archaeon]
MKAISKRILTIILAMMVLSLFVGEVQATNYNENDDSLIVSIESADYLDLDGDQLEDDILTEFTITVPQGDWDFRYTYIYCELVLPSGYYFNCLILMIGTYNSVTLTLGWYNTAIESGWYTFSLWAWGYGHVAPGLGSDSIVFDPPTEGDPGLPFIEIIQMVAE